MFYSLKSLLKLISIVYVLFIFLLISFPIFFFQNETLRSTPYKYRTRAPDIIGSLVGEKLRFRSSIMSSYETSCEIGSKLRWSLRLLVYRMANEKETMRDPAQEGKSKI